MITGIAFSSGKQTGGELVLVAQIESKLIDAASVNGPVYIRIARSNVPDIFGEDYKFNPSKAGTGIEPLMIVITQFNVARPTGL